MIRDLQTVIWKELYKFNNTRTTKMQTMIMLGLLGIYMPLITGLDWLLSPAFLIWMWLPMFTTIGFTTDAFAGERERHTLETLLATRLPDEAILLGKILASVLYSWGISVVSLLIAAAALNIAHPGNGLMFYDGLTFVLSLVGLLLMFFLFSCLGVLVSLKAHTVRQAYQRLSIAMLMIWLLPFILIQVIPREMLAQFMTQAPNLEKILISSVPYVFAGLLAAVVVLYRIARGKFKRDQLIADL
jgi:ABC-2 type transport system permease protein